MQRRVTLLQQKRCNILMVNELRNQDRKLLKVSRNFRFAFGGCRALYFVSRLFKRTYQVSIDRAHPPAIDSKGLRSRYINTRKTWALQSQIRTPDPAPRFRRSETDPSDTLVLEESTGYELGNAVEKE